MRLPRAPSKVICYGGYRALEGSPEAQPSSALAAEGPSVTHHQWRSSEIIAPSQDKSAGDRRERSYYLPWIKKDLEPWAKRGIREVLYRVQGCEFPVGTAKLCPLS